MTWACERTGSAHNAAGMIQQSASIGVESFCICFAATAALFQHDCQHETYRACLACSWHALAAAKLLHQLRSQQCAKVCSLQKVHALSLCAPECASCRW